MTQDAPDHKEIKNISLNTEPKSDKDLSDYSEAVESAVNKAKDFLQKSKQTVKNINNNKIIEFEFESKNIADDAEKLLDLLGFSFWLRENKITFDNKHEIERLYYIGILDSADTELSKTSEAAEFAPDLLNRADVDEVSSNPAFPIEKKKIPDIFAKAEDEKFNFKDVDNLDEFEKHYHGDVNYLYRAHRKKYVWDKGKLFRKTKLGDKVEITEEDRNSILESAKNGNIKDRNEFLIMNIPLLYVAVFNFFKAFPSANQSDLLQYALIRMNEYIDKYDIGKHKFTTYFFSFIDHNLMKFARENELLIHIPSKVALSVSKITRLDRSYTTQYGRKVTPYEIATLLGVSIEKARELVSLRAEISEAEYLDIENENLENEEALLEEEIALKQTLKKETAEVVNEILDSITPRKAKIIRLRFGIGINNDFGFSHKEIAAMFDLTEERVRQIESSAIRNLKHPSRSDKVRSLLNEM